MERLIPPAMMPTKTLRVVEPQYRPRYTLDGIKQLAEEFVAEQESDMDMLQWTFSIWLAWLAKREQGKGVEQ